MAVIWFFRSALQIFAGMVSSGIIGTAWYSENMFGVTWWSYHFPGIPFGKITEVQKREKAAGKTIPTATPFSFMMVLIVARSFILNLAMDAILPIVSTHSSVDSTCLVLMFVLVLSLINATTCLPGYVNSNEPIGLFVIDAMHDSMQFFGSIIGMHYIGQVVG